MSDEAFFSVLNCSKSTIFQGSNSVNVRVPGLSCNSVYHDSGRLDMSSVEMDRVGGVSLKTRPFQPVNSVNASTRCLKALRGLHEILFQNAWICF